MEDFFFSPWMWFIAAVLFLFLEMLAPGVVFLWIGIAAGATGLVVLQLPLFSPEMQLLVFAVLASLSSWAGRRYFRPRKEEVDSGLNRGGAALVGRRVEVSRAIRNGSGRVRVGDTEWIARGDDAPEGTVVEVTGADGAVLLVSAPETGKGAG